MLKGFFKSIKLPPKAEVPCPQQGPCAPLIRAKAQFHHTQPPLQSQRAPEDWYPGWCVWRTGCSEGSSCISRIRELCQEARKQIHIARDGSNLKATSPHSHLTQCFSIESIATQLAVSSPPHCNPALCMFTAGAGLCKKLTQLFSPTSLLQKSLTLKLSLVTWLGQLSTERLL